MGQQLERRVNDAIGYVLQLPDINSDDKPGLIDLDYNFLATIPKEQLQRQKKVKEYAMRRIKNNGIIQEFDPQAEDPDREELDRRFNQMCQNINANKLSK